VIGIAAPDIGPRERDYVAEAAQSGWLSSRGAFVPRFEDGFARFCGATNGIACSSGTSAVHLALAALGVGPGDEVIVPAFTMIGSVNPVRYLGATPVVCDALPDVWSLDPARVVAALTPRTKAIVVTHIYGHPADVDVIRSVAPGIPIVEDAAEAHGAQRGERRAGSLGDIAAFSFYANKILTTGEGGMVVTSDPALASRCRALRDHAFGGDESRYRHVEVGFSYRMSNLQAAVGVAQTERAAELVAASRRVGARYRAGLADVSGIQLQALEAGTVNVCWVFGLVVEEGSAPSRDELRAGLKEQGIESRDFFYPVHRQPAYSELASTSCPVAERLGARGLYLPSGPARKDDEIDAVCAAVKSLMR
jgi:perosamine synthetase